MKRASPWRGGEGLVLPLFTALLAVLIWGSGHPLAAQAVQGQLVDRETRAPVEGALVVLLSADGLGQDRYLTNAAGRFLLRARGKGTYTVRADRIGFSTVSSDPFTLSGGQLYRLTMETGYEAIQLDGITVQGEQQCVVRPGEGLETSRVWEEARKALTVQNWTETEGAYRFRVVNYSREMDPEARRVLEETRRVRTGVSRSPIESLPAEDLMAGGFVQENVDGTLQYYGPDASTLLSDIFLDTHCFELAGNEEEPNLLGLAFRPVRHLGFPDIQGTLWLDRGSSALQFLEYGYTWAPHPEAQGFARGRVEFEELPNGSWIVRKWWIRMPQLAEGRAQPIPWERPGVRVVGIRETGGEVLQVSSLDLGTISRAEGGLLTGLVWDSTRSAPLEGAQVFLSGTSYAGTTDAEGRFLLDGVSEGVFTAAFTHPRLDTLGTVAGGVDVEVIPGEVSEVHLGVSSIGSIVAEACIGETRREDSAVVTGLVLDQETGRSIPQATVRFTWQVVSGASGRLRGNDSVLDITTNGEGRFTVCSIPSDELIDIRARIGERESDIVQLRVERDSYTMMVFEVPPGSV